MSGPDYILDLSSKPAASTPPAPASSARDANPWLAVHWRCCSTYSRVYRNKDATAYEGKCPRCGAPVRAIIGEGGTSSRFFEAG